MAMGKSGSGKMERKGVTEEKFKYEILHMGLLKSPEIMSKVQ